MSQKRAKRMDVSNEWHTQSGVKMRLEFGSQIKYASAIVKSVDLLAQKDIESKDLDRITDLLALRGVLEKYSSDIKNEEFVFFVFFSNSVQIRSLEKLLQVVDQLTILIFRYTNLDLNFFVQDVIDIGMIHQFANSTVPEINIIAQALRDFDQYKAKLQLAPTETNAGWLSAWATCPVQFARLPKICSVRSRGATQAAWLAFVVGALGQEHSRCYIPGILGGKGCFAVSHEPGWGFCSTNMLTEKIDNFLREQSYLFNPNKCNLCILSQEHFQLDLKSTGSRPVGHTILLLVDVPTRNVYILDPNGPKSQKLTTHLAKILAKRASNYWPGDWQHNVLPHRVQKKLPICAQISFFLALVLVLGISWDFLVRLLEYNSDTDIVDLILMTKRLISIEMYKVMAFVPDMETFLSLDIVNQYNLQVDTRKIIQTNSELKYWFRSTLPQQILEKRKTIIAPLKNPTVTVLKTQIGSCETEAEPYVLSTNVFFIYFQELISVKFKSEHSAQAARFIAQLKSLLQDNILSVVELKPTLELDMVFAFCALFPSTPVKMRAVWTTPCISEQPHPLGPMELSETTPISCPTAPEKSIRFQLWSGLEMKIFKDRILVKGSEDNINRLIEEAFQEATEEGQEKKLEADNTFMDWKVLRTLEEHEECDVINFQLNFFFPNKLYNLLFQNMSTLDIVTALRKTMEIEAFERFEEDEPESTSFGDLEFHRRR